MKPANFLTLAIVTAFCVAVALVTYATSRPWDPDVRATGTRALAGLEGDTARIKAFEIARGKDKLRIEETDGKWLIKSEGGYPADSAKVRAFILAATEAALAERKTAKEELHEELGLSNPESENSSARLIRFYDRSGSKLDEIIAGKTRSAGSGSTGGGTYVRRPGEQQTWLADRSLSATPSIRDWVKTKLIELSPDTIKSVSINPAGDTAYDINRAADGKTHELAKLPDGKKLKYVNAIDEIVEAISLIEFQNVRKAGTAKDVPVTGSATFTTDAGFKVSIEFRSDGKEAWTTFTSSGEGQGKTQSDALAELTAGWEFKVPLSEMNAILKKQPELLEDASS